MSYDFLYPINALRNLAIQEADTPYVFFTDADFIPNRDLLQQITAAVANQGGKCANGLQQQQQEQEHQEQQEREKMEQQQQQQQQQGEKAKQQEQQHREKAEQQQQQQQQHKQQHQQQWGIKAQEQEQQHRQKGEQQEQQLDQEEEQQEGPQWGQGRDAIAPTSTAATAAADTTSAGSGAGSVTSAAVTTGAAAAAAGGSGGGGGLRAGLMLVVPAFELIMDGKRLVEDGEVVKVPRDKIELIEALGKGSCFLVGGEVMWGVEETYCDHMVFCHS